MREQINNWKNSKKFAELQEQLKEKKQQLINLKFDIMAKEEFLTRDELIQLIKAIKEADEINCEVDYDYHYFAILGTQDEIMGEYIDKLANWFMYLKKYLDREEYEICAGIRDCIQIEQKTFYDLCLRYRGDDQYFLDKITELPDRIYNKYINK